MSALCNDSCLFLMVFAPVQSSLFPLSLRWQRATPLKPSPSLTMLDAPPESCPSRRGRPCCCTREHLKTGGRDDTMALTAWCHTSTLWSKTCECFYMNMLNIIYTNIKVCMQSEYYLLPVTTWALTAGWFKGIVKHCSKVFIHCRAKKVDATVLLTKCGATINGWWAKHSLADLCLPSALKFTINM